MVFCVSPSPPPLSTPASLFLPQAAMQVEQQKAQMQAIVSRLSDLAFTKCVQKPSAALSSSEESCINATVFKYFDTSEFVLGRLMKSQQGGGGM